jgi:adenylate cyclase
MECKLAVIFSADVQGYSRLMGDDEEGTIRTLTAYREVMTRLIAQHRGRIADSPGDNVLAEFASAVEAVQCAVAVQREIASRNTVLPPHRQMVFRIGINLGDVVVEGERLYGDGVNIAARLEGLAEGGGICISGTVYDHVETKLALGYASMGEQTVKNITRPVRVYRVLIDAEAAGHRRRLTFPVARSVSRRAVLAVVVALLLVGGGRQRCGICPSVLLPPQGSCLPYSSPCGMPSLQKMYRGLWRRSRPARTSTVSIFG